ncbi:MAG: tRNA (adenosine(37)-N6)-dimethylallyltransferase MiaA [Alphaproteobacteria bacterium]
MNELALLIAGPTASGKSGAALHLARALGGTVINADSMQVYRDLRILTARPSHQEEAAVPHALYGVLDGADPCSAGRWAEMAGQAAREARAAGRVPVFAGGTGLYFRALTEGLSAMPEIPPALRARVRARLAERGAERTHAELAARDPESAARIRPSDRQRIARALEVLEATGRGLAAWQAEAEEPVLRPGSWRGLVLAPPREVLHERVEARFDAMLAAGALEEVRALAARRLDPGLPVMKAVGVPPLIAHLEGRLTLAEAAEAAKTDSRRYVKRQLTWFRNQMTGAWTWLTGAGSEKVNAAALSWAREALSGR